MTSVVIGIPVLRDGRRFHLQKGRRWTIVEHLILEALAKKEYSVAELTASANIQRRVVIEVLIRLMRAGWAQLTMEGGKAMFSATPHGRAYASRMELPPVVRQEKRYISYTLELLTGSIFRARDLVTLTDEQWRRRTAGRPSVLIPDPGISYIPAPSFEVLADKLLEDDEEITRVDFHDWRPTRRIGVVTVSRDVIEGVSGVLPPQLQDELLKVANDVSAGSRSYVPATPIKPSVAESKWHRCAYRSGDLVLGGDAHRAALTSVINRARVRLVIHSTFISPEYGRSALDLLQVPVRRGAVVDVLWGQSAEKDGLNDTRAAARQMREQVERAGFADRIRIHSTSTRSHAKVLLADAGERDRYVAVVGSCNWLSSGFNSFEASFRCRDNGVIADVAHFLAELARPKDGQITDFVAEMGRLGRQLQRLPEGEGGGASIRLVRGPEHADRVLAARDEATSRIAIFSHRLGSNVKPTISALAAAARPGQVRAEAYYGRVTGSVTSGVALDEMFRRRSEGLTIQAIEQPRLHAKVLLWDDDNAVITSMNWLSADPGPLDLTSEVGVHVTAPGVGRTIFKQFRTSRDFA